MFSSGQMFWVSITSQACWRANSSHWQGLCSAVLSGLWPREVESWNGVWETRSIQPKVTLLLKGNEGSWSHCFSCIASDTSLGNLRTAGWLQHQQNALFVTQAFSLLHWSFIDLPLSRAVTWKHSLSLSLVTCMLEINRNHSTFSTLSTQYLAMPLTHCICGANIY